MQSAGRARCELGRLGEGPAPLARLHQRLGAVFAGLGLQHDRQAALGGGEEAAGMAVANGTNMMVTKNLGRVTTVFKDGQDLPHLLTTEAHLAIGHTRYSTAGNNTFEAAQPVWAESKPGSNDSETVALAHNGNLTNYAELCAASGYKEKDFPSDSHLVGQLIADELAAASIKSLSRAVAKVMRRLDGGYSLVIMNEKELIGLRDRHGHRPLSVARKDSGWTLASETPAHDITGATYIRDIEPGEMVVINQSGIRSEKIFPEEYIDPKLCLFEFVYFARPDGHISNQSVYAARFMMGKLMHEQAPVRGGTVTIGVPESGLIAAEGFSEASGIPHRKGFYKSTYSGRTFILPTQDLRETAVFMKLNPIKDNIVGQRLVVTDDSIMRGTTHKQAVRLLREAGADEVHLRLMSPPNKYACNLGINTPTNGELLANGMTIPEMQNHLEVDSLAFLSLDRLKKAAGAVVGFCDACMTGDYPKDMPVTLLPGRKQRIA